MPTYVYECAKCGKTIEVIQKMSDKPLKKHEKCGGALTKLISAAGFQFKGTGWYVTDYGRNGKTPSTAANGKSDSKSDSAGDSKSDSNGKSESKTETKSETKSESKAESKPAPASTSSDK